MVYYKKIERTIKVDGKERKPIKLRAEIFSYDKQVSKFVFTLTNEEYEFDLTAASTLVVLEYSVDGQQGSIEAISGVESIADSQIYFIVPEKLRGFVGTVKAGIYVNLKSGEQIDIQNIQFKMSKSMIDSMSGPAADFYFESFNDVLVKVKAVGDKAIVDVNAAAKKVSDHADQKIKEYDGKFTQSNQKMNELQQSQIELSDQLDETNKKIDEADVYRRSETFSREESSANVINSIGGTSSAILKKELLVNGTEGTASRYVKDLPYQNKLFSSGDPYKKTELFAIQSLEGTQDYIDGARVFKSKGNWSAARVMKKNIDLFGFDYSKKYVLCEMMKWVPNDRDDKETCDIGYYASGNITDETNTIVAKIPARDTYTLVKSKVLTFNSEAIDTAQFRLEPSNIIPDGSTSRGSLYRYGLGLYESGKEPSDGWYPSCEDYGIVHGQPNLLNGTSNEWKEYTVQSWDDGTYKSVKLGDIGLKVGDTITFASELDHKSGIGYASSKLHFFDANNTSLGQKTGNGIMAGNKGVASITTEIPTGATSLRWYNFTKSNNTDLGTIAVRGHKLIKGTLATMDEWTPSQSDSGLTPINEGMVPFTDDEYATLLSSDGIVRAETDIVGRGAEIQFDFDVIGTLEDRYPYVFEGLTTAKQKSDKFFELVRTVSLSHTSRGYGYLGSSLQNNCRAYQVTLSASGTINWGLGDRQPSSNFVEKTGLFTLGNLQQFHDNRFYKITVSTKSNRGINPDTSVSSDGITPAWVEVKDIRLIVELEVNGRTIIEEMIAAYHGEMMKPVNILINDLVDRVEALEGGI